MPNSIGLDCLHNGELPKPAFIPTRRKIKGWNKSATIWFKVGMVRTEGHPAPQGSGPPMYHEALCTMSSTASSASFEQLALPVLPSLYSHAFWLCRNHAEAEDLCRRPSPKLFVDSTPFMPGPTSRRGFFVFFAT